MQLQPQILGQPQPLPWFSSGEPNILLNIFYLRKYIDETVYFILRFVCRRCDAETIQKHIFLKNG